jgi:hypothetical protein
MNGNVALYVMSDEPGSPDCRLVIDAKRSLEDVLRVLDGMPHTDHIRRQLLSVYNQLEGMHDLKRAGGADVSFRSTDWCSAK